MADYTVEYMLHTCNAVFLLTNITAALVASMLATIDVFKQRVTALAGCHT